MTNTLSEIQAAELRYCIELYHAANPTGLDDSVEDYRHLYSYLTECVLASPESHFRAGGMLWNPVAYMTYPQTRIEYREIREAVQQIINEVKTT